MIKEVIKSLTEQKKKVEKEIDEHRAFSIKTGLGNEKLIGIPNGKHDTKYVGIGGIVEKESETHILGHPISKKSPHTMMGKKIIKQ